MPLQFVRADITNLHCDAIVNAANNSLLGGGGVDGAIHAAAGPELLKECRTLGGCETGDAKITKAYKLPCRFVIHTVGPIWQGGCAKEEALLRSCYLRSLEAAKSLECQSVAFPLISAGVYGYPKAAALDVAAGTIREWLEENDMLVYLVIFDKEVLQIGEEKFSDIRRFIDDNYVSLHVNAPEEAHRAAYYSMPLPSAYADLGSNMMPASVKPKQPKKLPPAKAAGSLRAYLEQQDESFSEMLLRKIDEKGLKDSDCYKKANIDRKLFSKIRSDAHYKPSKQTAIAFAVALELPYEEATDLLKKAGYALSHSSRFDLIIEYFIRNGKYNIFEINEALFAFDQVLLGS